MESASQVARKHMIATVDSILQKFNSKVRIQREEAITHNKTILERAQRGGHNHGAGC